MITFSKYQVLKSYHKFMHTTSQSNERVFKKNLVYINIFIKGTRSEILIQFIKYHWVLTTAKSHDTEKV